MVANGDDFTARLMNDMDPALLDFIKLKVNSFIKWDLVRFFCENPNTADTVENIAKYTGRDAAAVKPELEDLVETGVMEKRTIEEQEDLVESEVMEKQTVEGTSIYSLAENQDTRELVDRFVLACEDRHFRVKAVYHIIRGMQ